MIEWLIAFLRGLLAQQELGKLTDDRDALRLAVTGTVPLPTFGEPVADEEHRAREAIVAFARQQLGEPYVFGAEGPADKDLDRWDCSELVEHAYCSCGMSMVDGARYQRDYCQRVREPLPGDLGYFGPNSQGVPHIVIYAGDGVCIEARGRKVNGVQRGVVQNTPRFEIEAHARFEGWYRHPDFARPKEDRV